MSVGAVDTVAPYAVFEPLAYPAQAVTEFNDAMLDRVSTGPNHISNRGYDETGLYLSPYWTCCIEGEDIPVYAVMSYNEDENRGVLQSFATVFVKEFSHGINIEFNACDRQVSKRLQNKPLESDF